MNTKLLQLMLAIPDEESLEKLNEKLIELKLIPQTKFSTVDHYNITTKNGLVLQYVVVGCDLTITDAETGEIITCSALGEGLSEGAKSMQQAQDKAKKYTWMTLLNIQSLQNRYPNDTPQVIVETPESKLIDQIKAIWKWGEAELEPYIAKRRGKPMSELSIPELTVERDELESYLRGRSKNE